MAAMELQEQHRSTLGGDFGEHAHDHRHPRAKRATHGTLDDSRDVKSFDGWLKSFTELEIFLSMLAILMFIVFLVYFIYRLAHLDKCFISFWGNNYKTIYDDVPSDEDRPEFHWGRY